METGRTIFKPVPLASKSLLRRLFKQRPPGNAVIELNNLLAMKGVYGVDEAQLQNIETKYGILFSAFALNLEEFYAVYWSSYIKAGANDAELEAETYYLSRLLKLKDETVRMLRNGVGEASFRKETASRLKKRRMTDADKDYLQNLGLKLRLEEVVTVKVIDEEKTKVLDDFLTPVKKKNRCTPEEGLEAEAIMVSFEMSLSKIKMVGDQLKPLKYYWELEHLPLKALNHSGNLQKSEVCFLEIKQVKWLETRSAGRGYQQLEQVNYGTLYLTNKRLVFEGNAKNSVIPFDRIRGTAVQSNGVVVQKDKGKDPVLVFPGDHLVFELVVKRLLKGY